MYVCVHYFSSTTRAPCAASGVPTNSPDETRFQKLLPPRIQRMQFIHTCKTHTQTHINLYTLHTRVQQRCGQDDVITQESYVKDISSHCSFKEGTIFIFTRYFFLLVCLFPLFFTDKYV